jgi:membrane protein YqaA with SNARE-associated domain
MDGIVKRPNVVRRLYDWVLHWAETPYAEWALFFIAFVESSVFPIPPDVLLSAMAVAVPRKSFRYAAICSIGSVLGGILGYMIGWQFMTAIGEPIIRFYGLMGKVEYIQSLYQQYDAWAVGIAGFTPLPYKIFTIAAGAFHIRFSVFVIASIVSRSARFFLVAGLFYFFGAGIQSFIDKYFDILAVAFTVCLIGGFVIMKAVV